MTRERTRCDTIAIKGLFVWKLFSFTLRLFSDFFGFLRSAETPTPLLVHLRTRSDTIYSHEKQLFGLDLAEEVIDIGED